MLHRLFLMKGHQHILSRKGLLELFKHMSLEDSTIRLFWCEVDRFSELRGGVTQAPHPLQRYAGIEIGAWIQRRALLCLVQDRYGIERTSCTKEPGAFCELRLERRCRGLGAGAGGTEDDCEEGKAEWPKIPY